MQARYYTLDEAKAALPTVKALMSQVQEVRSEIIRLRPEIWPVLQKAAQNGGNAAAGSVYSQFDKLETSVKGIL